MCSFFMYRNNLVYSQYSCLLLLLLMFVYYVFEICIVYTFNALYLCASVCVGVCLWLHSIYGNLKISLFHFTYYFCSPYKFNSIVHSLKLNASTLLLLLLRLNRFTSSPFMLWWCKWEREKRSHIKKKIVKHLFMDKCGRDLLR